MLLIWKQLVPIFLPPPFKWRSQRIRTMRKNVLTETNFWIWFKIWYKALLRQGISEPIFYSGLVYKFKRIVESLILVIN